MCVCVSVEIIQIAQERQIKQSNRFKWMTFVIKFYLNLILYHFPRELLENRGFCFVLRRVRDRTTFYVFYLSQLLLFVTYIIIIVLYCTGIYNCYLFILCFFKLNFEAAFFPFLLFALTSSFQYIYKTLLTVYGVIAIYFAFFCTKLVGLKV